MQCELFPTERRGGKRKGAGRPKKGVRASERHRKREEVRAYWPVHVTLRVAADAPYLRKRSIWRAIAKATIAASKKGSIRIIHASVQTNHLHILVEAKDKRALATGMHAFEVSAAHWINLAAKRRGHVFPDRYHSHVLKTPREARNALRYVLNNWRKHGEANNRFAMDPFSTGYAYWNADAADEPLAISQPRSWLLRTAGPISPYDVPSSRG
ncbi:MAG TPA: transposase [Kofleriaceae bacterium]|jgi:REP element-mobilizing transposase RayT